MKISLLVVGLALCSMPLLAHAANERPQGENCSHALPPTGSGEDFANNVLFRVYPRTPDISPNYRGCQAVWRYTEKGASWTLVSLVEFKDGGPFRLWTEDKAMRHALGCRYRSGEVIQGDPKRCLSQGRLYTPSLPSGCLKKIDSALKVVGPAAPRAMHECRME